LFNRSNRSMYCKSPGGMSYRPCRGTGPFLQAKRRDAVYYDDSRTTCCCDTLNMCADAGKQASTTVMRTYACKQVAHKSSFTNITPINQSHVFVARGATTPLYTTRV
jgi:hypothetical protein